MALFRLAALLLVMFAYSAKAQPKTGQIQPDGLPIGVVYKGSTVEASFMVFERGKDANIALQVQAPKFVKLLNVRTDARQYGPGNDFITGSVDVSFDTSAVGELNGEITVTLGQTTAKLPASVTVKPRKPGLTRVLIAETVFHQVSTVDSAMFRPWTDLVQNSPLDASYLLLRRDTPAVPRKPVLRDLDLGKFDCLLIAEAGLVMLTPADVKRVREFAEAGGRVVVPASKFMTDSVSQANKLIEGYGLKMVDEESSGREEILIQQGGLDRDLIKAGIETVHFYRGSPIGVTDPKLGRVLVNAAGIGQPGEGFVALAKAGKGEIAVIGQSVWHYWISETRAKGHDNAKLLSWLLVRPKT